MTWLLIAGRADHLRIRAVRMKYRWRNSALLTWWIADFDAKANRIKQFVSVELQAVDLTGTVSPPIPRYWTISPPQKRTTG